jgi:hypothetical protein
MLSAIKAAFTSNKLTELCLSQNNQGKENGSIFDKQWTTSWCRQSLNFWNLSLNEFLRGFQTDRLIIVFLVDALEDICWTFSSKDSLSKQRTSHFSQGYRIQLNQGVPRWKYL